MINVCRESDIRAELVAMKTGVYALEACAEHPKIELRVALPITKIDDINHIFVPTSENNRGLTNTLEQELSFVMREFRSTFKRVYCHKTKITRLRL